MNLAWPPQAWEDYLYWQKIDRKKLKSINELIKSCPRTPYEGIGKPEGLKNDLQGFGSRRIDSKHRLVHTVQQDQLIITACR